MHRELEPISQTPMPDVSQTSAVTTRNVRRPESASRNPSTSSGTEFPIRWAQSAWISGPNRIPDMPASDRGRIPLPAKRPGRIASSPSISHNSATNPPASTADCRAATIVEDLTPARYRAGGSGTLSS